MKNRHVAAVAAALVEAPSQRGAQHSIRRAIQAEHGFTAGAARTEDWINRAVSPIAPLILDVNSIEYIDVVVDSTDHGTVAGDVVVITRTHIIKSKFETVNNNNLVPTAEAEAWRRADVRRLKYSNPESPELDDLDETWEAAGTLTVAGEHGLLVKLPARPGREDALADLAASFLR